MPHILLTVHGTVPTMWALGRQQDIVQHMRALPHVAVAYALATVRASQASVTTKRAFEFLVLTAARSGEVRLATWDEMVQTPASTQDFLFGRPGTYTIADYRLRCNGFRTAARFGTPFAAAPAKPEGPLAFTETRAKALQPWPQMHDCPNRAILDQAAAKVLRVDGRTIADWRKRIAREPTVFGKLEGNALLF